MSGSFGVDLQHSRTVVALVTGTPGGLDQRIVGDGRRALVPNAAAEGTWGTAALPARMRATLPERVTSGGDPLAWCQPPWSPELLSGLRLRLDDFLGGGQVRRAGRNGVCVTGIGTEEEARGSSWPVRRGLLRAAGFAEPVRAAPTDALLVRYLADLTWSDDRAGLVVAVAVGETETTVRGYHLAPANGLPAVRRAGGESRIDAGSLPWSSRLVREVLTRCGEGADQALLVSLLDGALEHAARLAAGPPGRLVAWRGPLADRLLTPVRHRGEELAQAPDVRLVTEPVAALVERVVQTAARDGGEPLLVVLVGGIGAVWPFVGWAVGPRPVWRSIQPECDLALGAALWPLFADRVRGPQAANRAAATDLDAGAPAPAEVVAQPIAPTRRDSALAPWLRQEE